MPPVAMKPSLHDEDHTMKMSERIAFSVQASGKLPGIWNRMANGSPDHGVTLDALALPPAGFCSIGVNQGDDLDNLLDTK